MPAPLSLSLSLSLHYFLVKLEHEMKVERLVHYLILKFTQSATHDNNPYPHPHNIRSLLLVMDVSPPPLFVAWTGLDRHAWRGAVWHGMARRDVRRDATRRGVALGDLLGPDVGDRG